MNNQLYDCNKCDETYSHQIHIFRQYFQHLLRENYITEARLLLQRLIPYYKKRPYISLNLNSLDVLAKKIPSHHVDNLNKKEGKEGQVSDEYAWSLSFHPHLFSHLCYEGFLSISSYPCKLVHILLPRMHTKRCIMNFGNIHISKKNVRKSKYYYITVDRSFRDVLQGCLDQHGENWLYPPMIDLLIYLNENGYNGTHSKLQKTSFGVHSIELWDRASNKIVAGEIGYVVGSSYTSMTGFYASHTNGCGTLQLISLCCLLQKLGFIIWDLGMVMEYKINMGGTIISKEEFTQRLKNVRDVTCHLSGLSNLSVNAQVLFKDHKMKISM